ncbi:MAG: MFS transporter [Roseburia sp.]|nr:MFS transporter [Roseburia sp.]
MAIVEARCLKCKEIIDVDSDDDAGICPNCGAAYVTEKVIKNYRGAKAAKAAVQSEFDGLSALAEKYNAYVALYKTDGEAFLELFKTRSELRKQHAELKRLADKHDDLIFEEEKWRDIYNSRASDFNKTSYYGESYREKLSETVHRKFVESAKNKHDATAKKITSARVDFRNKQEEFEKRNEEGKELAAKVYTENYEYDKKALAVANTMCEKYPSNPLGYLFKADWYRRDIEHVNDIIKYVKSRCLNDADVVYEAERDMDDTATDKIKEELKNANTFITKEFCEQYADIVNSIKYIELSPETSKAKLKGRMPVLKKKSEQDSAGGGASAGGKAGAKAKKGVGHLNIAATIVGFVPLILELLVVLLIPHISLLAENEYVACWGWQELSVAMRVSFLSLIVLGVGVQVLGLFDKLGNVVGMITQLVTFALFVLAVYAANKNVDSVYTQWGIALFVPITLVVAALRYMSADGFGFLDDFGFWHFLPIALETAEYALFFLVFPPMFGVSASLWMFVAFTVTTVAAICVTSFWEDARWIAAGVNLGIAALLCLIYWLGRLFNSEWMWNGGVIIVVILAIGGTIFGSWFVHRNDP